jgi:V/A-type H+-transporting ATPase subunit A
VRVAGPVVAARGLEGVRMQEVVRVGLARLLGEVIRLDGPLAVIQAYEETSGLRAGEPVLATGEALSVELGPGLLGGLLDGVGRSLRSLAALGGDPFARPFLERGADLPALPRERAWDLEPAVRAGARVEAGDLLATCRETPGFVYKVLVPPGFEGVVDEVRAGPARADDVVARVGGRPVTLARRWPVRRPRPLARRLPPDRPLVTGQRILDVLFPLAKGGAATVPGGFGTGKTVLEQSIARFAEADVVVYVGCGERGNELAEVLETFPRALDPRTGGPLLARTVLVANTSNMPVAAREASIYTGMTIAEHFRDQGCDALLLADSTSRWGEALREISGRLEEMPGEEGYPAYLAARLAEFYERAGDVVCLGREGRRGSVTVIGAVSPPGGDMSEPISQASLRLAGALWMLDPDLARRRHFPALAWTRCTSLYDLASWFEEHVDRRWEEDRRWALALLEREAGALEMVQVLGADALAPSERALIATGRRIREGFLAQSSFDPLDASCPLAKQHAMLAAFRGAHEALLRALAAGASVESALALPALAELERMRAWPSEEARARGKALLARIEEGLRSLVSLPGTPCAEAAASTAAGDAAAPPRDDPRSSRAGDAP